MASIVSSRIESLWPEIKAGHNLPMLATAAVLVYIIWKILSSTVFHPLGHLPGPRLCAVTKIPYWILAVRGNQIPWMQRLHAEYGPVVRFGPNDVSYTDPQAWKDIYGHRKGQKENPRCLKFYPDVPNGAPSMADIRDAAAHIEARRIMAPAFSEKALREQEPTFQHLSELMVAAVRRGTITRQEEDVEGEKTAAGAEAAAAGPEAVPPVVDMVKMYSFATFDILASLLYGESLGMLETSAYTPWVASLLGWFRLVPVAQILQTYPLLGSVFRLLEPASVRRVRRDHFRYSAERLHRRLARGPTHPDIWSTSLLVDDDNDDDRGKSSLMTVPELEANSMQLMTAGTETSASLLAGLTYLLLRNPRCMGLLKKEIRGAFGPGSGPPADGEKKEKKEVTFEALARLPYLNACIEEGLRVFPPIPQGLARQICEGGNEVLGEWLPEGTSVSVCTIATHRDPNHFRDADDFVPERWMGDPRYANDRREARQPFSYGPRNCLGMGLAWHEMRLLLSKKIINFDLELCNQEEDWMDQKIFVVWEKKPLMCRAIPIKRDG
ncbi:cytochrome P450 [Xylariomycetidae sp. FL2044]|nr:cytochrome P450 [Xylariomycetidae sp. FL2044]